MSSNGTREILYDKLVKQSFEKKIRLNIVAFNCLDKETNEFLRRAAGNSYGIGKFHSYTFLKQYDDFINGVIDNDPTKINVIKNVRFFGGAPNGSGVKSDLMCIFEEIQIAQQTLENLNAILNKIQQESLDKQQQTFLDENISNENNLKNYDNDEYSTSAKWLEKNDLDAKNLSIFQVLNKFCFRHCDGVVDIKKEPINGKTIYLNGRTYFQGDAVIIFSSIFFI
jgi:hypothetical protein